MSKFKSIAWKLSGIIIGVFVLLFLIYTLSTSTILHKQSTSDAEEYAVENTQLNAKKLSERFNKTNEMLHTTKHILETLQSQGNLTTDEILAIIQNNLKKNADAMGMSAIFEKGFITLDEQLNQSLVDSQKRFIPYLYKEGSSISIEALSEYETPGVGDWYLIPKSENRAIMTEPYEYKAGGQNILITTLSVPLVSENGQFFGVLTTDLSIEFLNELVNEIKPEGGYASIISEKGNLTASSLKDELVGTNMKQLIDWDPVKQKLDNYETSKLYIDSSLLNEQAFNTFAPIVLDQIDEKWSVETVVPKSKILETYNKILWITIGAAILMIILMTTVTAGFIFKQLKPLSSLQQSIEAAAKGDMTQNVGEQLIRNDEIGAVSMAYNNMLDQTNHAIHAVREAATRLNESSTHVHQAFEEIVAASEEVSLATNEIAHGASKQSEDTEETSNRMSELADQIKALSELSGNMNQLSEQTVSSTEIGMNEVIKLREHNASANEMTEKVQLQMETLSNKIGAINQVIISIHDITAQTNLLALNASIEAARAGEHGKGFAVVAEEVRNLAEQSQKETSVIQGIVQEIVDESKHTTEVIATNMQVMVEQNQSVTSTEASFSQNVELTNQMRQAIMELSAELEEMLVHKDQAMLVIQSVSAVSEETAASAEQVSASSAAQQTEVERVADSTNRMKEIAEELQTVVDRFRLE